MGQLVRVNRQTKHSLDDERQWVIELPDQTCMSIPLSWAVLVEANTESESIETNTSSSSGLLVDVTTLLNLARMVHYIAKNQSEEVTYDETSTCRRSTSRDTQPSTCETASSVMLERSARGISAQVVGRPSDDVGQGAAGALPNEEGEKR